MCESDRRIFSASTAPDVLEIRFGGEAFTNVGYQAWKIVEDANADKIFQHQLPDDKVPAGAKGRPAPESQSFANAIVIQQPVLSSSVRLRSRPNGTHGGSWPKGNSGTSLSTS